MPRHAETRFLPYTPEQMFDLVADIERYPEFLPWCVGMRVRERRDNVITADLMVGFRMIREKFTSQVTLQRPSRIDVIYIDGPFKHMENHWLFKPHDGGCMVEFFIDFEFRSRMLRLVMEPLFHEAVRRMVGAFETRAAKLYSRPSSRSAPQGVPGR
jgi:coenzyme Q-binding protein COQ10